MSLQENPNPLDPFDHYGAFTREPFVYSLDVSRPTTDFHPVSYIALFARLYSGGFNFYHDYAAPETDPLMLKMKRQFDAGLLLSTMPPEELARMDQWDDGLFQNHADVCGSNGWPVALAAFGHDSSGPDTVFRLYAVEGMSPAGALALLQWWSLGYFTAWEERPQLPV
ncbi:hypothetical protein A2Z33_04445 [Candidatus Gottesmanbacteria bacterium RBG_16_52_11]|uniref:Uncharacterized protein n=1 Tax=Candidatus Gottesmanbacteria bacterium RBG_16_52_11 TaxID=1798374 RepID=A0A1F5YWV7_9BACT|nr:MAG: hypothetical protein A2Z33_04445 [Candidatus Gottesmanbacteria bacterium RBG_16_52_11]